MKKTISSICLVAGTAIGAGTIALPLVLVKIGISATVLLMLSTWALCYYTALMGLELNLRAKKGLTLGELGSTFSGLKAQWIGTISMLFLCYGLLCAYLSGAGSVLTNITTHLGYNITAYAWTNITAILLFLVLVYGIKIVMHMNKYFFYILMVGFSIMIAWLVRETSLENIILNQNQQQNHLNSWTIGIPVLFTSFGFHVVFHTLSNYLNMDKNLLKKAFWWGSLITASIYMAWTLGILLFISQKSPSFYDAMVFKTISVGELIGQLGALMNTPHAHLLIWIISLFAILTSLLGVGIALKEQLSEKFSNNDKSSSTKEVMITLMTIMPAYGIAIYIPDAFIKALGFAGMILVVIAILLPLYLLYRSDEMMKTENRETAYPILNHYLLRWIVGLVGIGIIATEVYNMVSF